MEEIMRSFWRYLEELSHGGVLGGFIGLLAGCTEYLLFVSGTTYSGNLARAYWDIVLAYGIVGATGGIGTA